MPDAIHPETSFLMSLGFVGREVFALANSVSMFSISTEPDIWIVHNDKLRTGHDCIFAHTGPI